MGQSLNVDTSSSLLQSDIQFKICWCLWYDVTDEQEVITSLLLLKGGLRMVCALIKFSFNVNVGYHTAVNNLWTCVEFLASWHIFTDWVHSWVTPTIIHSTRIRVTAHLFKLDCNRLNASDCLSDSASASKKMSSGSAFKRSTYPPNIWTSEVEKSNYSIL